MSLLPIDNHFPISNPDAKPAQRNKCVKSEATRCAAKIIVEDWARYDRLQMEVSCVTDLRSTIVAMGPADRQRLFAGGL
jgi:hypothetical protein